MKKDFILLFDLDDTLIVEENSAFNALSETAGFLSEYNVDHVDFARKVKIKAREIWRSLPVYQYCLDIGISSWEGLWANFIGDNPNLKLLYDLKDDYRVAAWNNTLVEFNIHEEGLAKQLSDRYNRERRKRHILFPETLSVLKKLKSQYRMGLITNGCPDLQWEKINGSGIKSFFDTIIISGEVNVAKPGKEIFNYVFDFFKKEKSKYIMIGNSLESDIHGALNAGISSVWVNREKIFNNSRCKPDHEITCLDQLFDILKQTDCLIEFLRE